MRRSETDIGHVLYETGKNNVATTAVIKSIKRTIKSRIKYKDNHITKPPPQTQEHPPPSSSGMGAGWKRMMGSWSCSCLATMSTRQRCSRSQRAPSRKKPCGWERRGRQSREDRKWQLSSDSHFFFKQLMLMPILTFVWIFQNLLIESFLLLFYIIFSKENQQNGIFLNLG